MSLKHDFCFAILLFTKKYSGLNTFFIEQLALISLFWCHIRFRFCIRNHVCLLNLIGKNDAGYRQEKSGHVNLFKKMFSKVKKWHFSLPYSLHYVNKIQYKLYINNMSLKCLMIL